jgi:hypothetical protein
MKAKFIVGTILLLAVIIINSCEDKKGVVPFVLNATNCDTTKLRYSSDSNAMQPIINANCAGSTGCHVPGGTAPTDFTSYSGLQADASGGKSSQIYQHLFIIKDMPLGKPPLDECTLTKFSVWLVAGAPQ